MHDTQTSMTAVPITQDAFSPFGDLIELDNTEPILINNGQCKRYSDLADIDIDEDQTGISLFHANIRDIPYQLTLMERHPLGSQAFLPMQGATYLVIVASDENNKPGQPKAFIAKGDQGVNIHRNVWHGVLTPLSGNGLFAVVDRIGEGKNLEEFRFEKPIIIEIDESIK